MGNTFKSIWTANVELTLKTQCDSIYLLFILSGAILNHRLIAKYLIFVLRISLLEKMGNLMAIELSNWNSFQEP